MFRHFKIRKIYKNADMLYKKYERLLYAELPNADKQDIRIELLLALVIYYLVPAIVRRKVENKDNTLAALITIDLLMENSHNNVIDNTRVIEALDDNGAFAHEMDCISEILAESKEKSVEEGERKIRSRTIDRLKYLYANNKSASFTDKEIAYKSDVASYSFGTKVGKMLDEFNEVMNSVAPLPRAV